MEIRGIYLFVLGISTASAFPSALSLATVCRSGATDQTHGAIHLRACAKPIYEAIQFKLTDGLKPIKLRIVDNSHQHAGMILS